MSNLTEQQIRYQRNWKHCAPHFGATFMPNDPGLIYWIGVRPSAGDADRLDNQHARIKEMDTQKLHRWLQPHELHVTSALPGRPNEPYGKQDLPDLIHTLQRIAKEITPFTVHMGDINCFPQALYREVYSDDETLFRLHEAISDAIPVSLKPEYTYKTYMPHMSLCYLKAIDPHLLDAASFDRHLEPISVAFNTLYLSIAYDEPGKPDDVLAKITLGTGSIQP